eukprot:m.490575 g.490575  ORF g.490575 m.490575 type:complete len:466 (-) comp28301_c0_seq1:61-1458(-)
MLLSVVRVSNLCCRRLPSVTHDASSVSAMCAADGYRPRQPLVVHASLASQNNRQHSAISRNKRDSNIVSIFAAAMPRFETVAAAAAATLAAAATPVVAAAATAVVMSAIFLVVSRPVNQQLVDLENQQRAAATARDAAETARQEADTALARAQSAAQEAAEAAELRDAAVRQQLQDAQRAAQAASALAERRARVSAEQAREEERRRAELQRRHDEESARLSSAGLDTAQYNVGFVGNAGTGKSTLINAFQRGQGTASVSAVGDCTTESSSHPWVCVPGVVLWDLPGGSTEDHPRESYGTDHCLEYFDLLILTYNRGSSWSQLCGHICAYARQHGKRVVVVYTDFHHAVENHAEDADLADIPLAARDLAGRVNQLLQTPRERHDLELPLYCVDSRSLKRQFLSASYDGPALVEEVVRSLAQRNPDGVTADTLWEQFRDTATTTATTTTTVVRAVATAVEAVAAARV